jgi:hypothetical protein
MFFVIEEGLTSRRRHQVKAASVVFAAFLTFFISVDGHSEPAKGAPENAVSVDLLFPTIYGISAGIGRAGVEVPIYLDYQRVLSDHFVLSLQPGVSISSDSRATLGAEVDWHPFDVGLRGLLVGAQAVWFRQGSDWTWIGAGMCLGYQFLFPSRLMLDFVAGAGPVYDVNSATGNALRFGVTRARIALGYAF